jgi:CPA1 family monovalent cation:H+ antiporter
MSFFQTSALLLTLAALAAFINVRWVKLPQTIGLMAIAMVGSLTLLLLGELGLVPLRTFAAFVSGIDFGDVLLHGMLSFLLFAGALHVDFGDLRRERFPVAILSTLGVVIATFVTGVLFWYGMALIGLHVSFLTALLFGALISPTDPIAVLGIIKKVGAPKRIETKIAGESLFNDGIGVVVFLTILGIATGQSETSPSGVGLLLLKEAAGGALAGLVLGWIVYLMLKAVDAYQVEVLLTLALVTGGYALAEALHVSAPIAMVVSGLFIGNRGRVFAMSDQTRERLDSFWELIDEILNAVLFMLIGLELIVIALHPSYLAAGLIAILVSLFGRVVSVGLPIGAMRFRQKFMRGTVRILTWGGLRGGISIALALSLPPSPERDIIIAATYMVVVFSVLVQGLTFGKVMKRFVEKAGTVGKATVKADGDS